MAVKLHIQIMRRIMDRIKEIYQALEMAHPGKFFGCIRRGNLDALFGLEGCPFDYGVTSEILEYGKQLAASKMTPPYKLADYLCYIYPRTDTYFAEDLDVTVEYIEQAIYDGCYWHDGMVLRPENPESLNITDFIGENIAFGVKDGKVHRASLWPTYVIWCGKTKSAMLNRIPFLSAVDQEMRTRGHALRRSVRIGDKVTTGYKGISVKII